MKRGEGHSARAMNASLLLVALLALWCAGSVRLGCPCWLSNRSLCTALEIGKTIGCAPTFLISPLIVALNLWKNRTRVAFVLLTVYVSAVAYVYVTAEKACRPPVDENTAVGISE